METINFVFHLVSKLKYSVEVGVYLFQTTVIKFLVNCFIHFELSKTLVNKTDFRSQYGFRLDWPRDEFCQSLYKNPCRKPVLFVSKAIMFILEV